jgi:hypothetical protein
LQAFTAGIGRNGAQKMESGETVPGKHAVRKVVAKCAARPPP